MDKLDQILELLEKATPMLQEFITWKHEQEVQEKAYQQEQSQTQKEFAAWLKQRQAEQAQEAKDADELKKDFFGNENWQKNHLTPRPY